MNENTPESTEVAVEALSRVDREFFDNTIRKVKGSEAKGWELSLDDGYVCWIPSFGRAPVAGERLRAWGRGPFSPRRGVAVGPSLVNYEAQGAYGSRVERELKEDEANRKRLYEAKKDDFDRRIAALPPNIGKILSDKLTAEPSFAWDHCGLAYNLYAFEQGVVIADALKTREALDSWRALPFAEQRALVPKLDDGHSGGTFGTALSVAFELLSIGVRV